MMYLNFRVKKKRIISLIENYDFDNNTLRLVIFRLILMIDHVTSISQLTSIEVLIL